MSIPTLTIQDPESEVDEVLLALQSAVLKHPAASQAILSALTAEGRQYAQTEEGKLVLTTLSESDLLQKLWRVWEGTSLWSFNPDEDCILPSAYVDALFMSAGSKDIESVIENLVNKDEPA
tara:strand:- start:15528 stop:15890 length:363 start_codon:yes stop_codon:yes gene_type:complete